MLSTVFYTYYGSILFSIILGIGLAALFRQTCKGSACYVIKGPFPQDVHPYYYKIGDDCFRYEPVYQQCV